MGDAPAKSGLTLGIVGCGNMGTAILRGVIGSIEETSKSSSETPLFTRFIAAVQSPGSAKQLEKTFSQQSSSVSVVQADNVKAMRQADVVMLGCKPYMVRDVLADEGVRAALDGKLIISVLGGISPQQIEEFIYGDAPHDARGSLRYFITTAIPNMAAEVGESMTVISTSNPPLPSHYAHITPWIFERVGRVKFLPPHLLDLGTMFMASVALMTVAFDGILDGCVAEGLKRSDATEMLTQCTIGMAKLIENGTHPAAVREQASSPKGCTIQGLLTLEAAAVRSTYAQAIINGTAHVKKMGKKDG